MARVQNAPVAQRGWAPPAGAEAPGGDWIGLGEASLLLGISQGTLRRWADDGRVSVFTTPGGHRRFSRRALRSLLPAARAQRPALSTLGASPERISRRYHTRGEAPVTPRWLDRLTDEERSAFRDRGRQIVSYLLDYLDAADAAARSRSMEAAYGLAAAHGREAGESGATIEEAVRTFLQFRTPFVSSLADTARRRGLDTREATELLVEAQSAMDTLLLGTMEGHAQARPPAAAR